METKKLIYAGKKGNVPQYSGPNTVVWVSSMGFECSSQDEVTVEMMCWRTVWGVNIIQRIWGLEIRCGVTKGIIRRAEEGV